MASSTASNALDEDIIKEAFEHIAALKIPACIHAEDPEMITPPDELSGTIPSYMVHARSRPPIVEAKAVEKVVNMAATIGLSLHLCHISTKESVEMMRNAKYVGLDVTSEVTPHHLLLNTNDLERLGAFGKMNPPLRSPMDNHQLWDGLNEGAIDIIASDHAPHLRKEKEEDMISAPAGVPGVETIAPLMLAHSLKGFIPLSRVIDALSSRVAECFGIAGKGEINVGFDADIALYNLKDVEHISDEHLHSKAGWSPFEGMDAVFPKLVFRRGEVVYEEGDVTGKKGSGKRLMLLRDKGGEELI